MAVDKSYGSGSSVSATTSASRRARAGSAALRKQNQKKFNRGTQIGGGKATMISGSSDYVQRENAARTQLGASGLSARKRQLGRASRATARGLLREVTGIDVSRKGVSVSPESLAMALPVGKVLKAAKALRLARRASEAAPLANRLVAKSLGKDAARLIAQNQGATNSFIRENVIANAKKVRNLSAESVFPRGPKPGPLGQPYLGDLSPLPYRTPAQVRRSNRARRALEQGDRVYELEKRLNLPGTAPKRGR